MLTPEALNALPGWAGVAFFLFYVCKTLLDLIKDRIGGKDDKSDKSDDDRSRDETKALSLAVARIEVRLDHLEGRIERLDDRVADLLREFSPLSKRGERP